ncbi:MAG: hypothetical protein KBD53_08090 [Candidatus Omnitrophica bacterium]|nr:hypothetical protein [Candidatus Omnitrophota bacterium]
MKNICRTSIILTVMLLLCVPSIMAKNADQKRLLPSAQKGSDAKDLVYEVNFDLKELNLIKEEGFDSFTLPDTISTGEAGQPRLPVKVINFAIDQNKKVERVELITDETMDVPGEFSIYPAQSTKVGENADITFPDSDVYGSSESFPNKRIELGSTGFISETKIASFLIYPLEYIPAKKKVIFHTKIKFKIILADEDPDHLISKPAIQRSINSGKVMEGWLSQIVVNSDDAIKNLAESSVENLREGFFSNGPINPPEIYDYLIITSNDFRDSGVFDPLISHKISRGLSVHLETVENIEVTMPGRDFPEKIRNYIIKVHKANGVLWVLLGGDTNIVQTRYVRPEELPSDLYYSDLDGDWDFNGNNIFGESGDRLDKYADVFVGRAPAKDFAEMAAFVNKVLNYDVFAPRYFKRVLLFGNKFLSDTGGITNDFIDENILPETVKPATKYYGREIYGYHDQARDAINEGHHLINHIDGASGIPHISPQMHLHFGSELYSFLTIEDIDALINKNASSIMTSTGPWAAAFDFDAIAEHWITNPTGGGVAFFGYSRDVYVLTMGLGTEIYSALFGKRITRLGQMLAYAKSTMIPYTAYPYIHALHSFTLLGDPEMTVMIQEDVAITEPANNAVVQGDVKVQGIMDAVNFEHYDLFYAPKYSPRENVLITSSTTPVLGDTLGVWNTDQKNLVEDGWYTLTLDVVKSGHRHVKTVTDVYLNNNNINLPPTFENINNPSITEGKLYQLPVRAIDPEGGGVKIDATLENGDLLSTIGASFSYTGIGPGTFSWTPETGQKFQYPILFKARDSEGNEAKMLVRITVIRPGNQFIGTVKEFISGVGWTGKPGVSIDIIKNRQVVDTVTTQNTDDQNRGLYWTPYLESQADHYIRPRLAHYAFGRGGQPLPPEGYGPFKPGEVYQHQLDFDVFQIDFQISGYVQQMIEGEPVPKPGVSINVIKNGQVIETLFTDADGKFTSSHLEGMADHYFLPSLPGYNFTQGSDMIPPGGYGPIKPHELQSQPIAFDAHKLTDIQIRGIVQEMVDGEVVGKPGVSVAIIRNGEVIETLTTNAEGKYISSELGGLLDYYIMPSFPGYEFTQDFLPIPPEGYGPIMPYYVQSTSIQFEGHSMTAPKIFGNVSELVNGQRVGKSGVTINVIKNGRVIERVRTDAEGNYTTYYLEGMADHYILPSLENYVFIQGEQIVPPEGVGPFQPSEMQGQSLDFEALAVDNNQTMKVNSDQNKKLKNLRY